MHAVRGIDLTIAPGEIVAVLGPNGAGKSTTNEMILGMIRPDAGIGAGLRPGPAQRRPRPAGSGAMLQAGALLQEATVIDVLRLMHGLHAHPLPLAEVIERADLGGFLKTKTDKLSGGQAQRLRYALAIMPDPELLILDEPTVGMDVEIRRAFWASMRDFTAGGRTVLFATHYLEEADAVADRIVVLDDGRVVADGTGAEIKSRVAGRTDRRGGRQPGLAAVAAPAGRGCVPSDAVPRLLLHTADSDARCAALLDSQSAGAATSRSTSARLEDAFLALTATER